MLQPSWPVLPRASPKAPSLKPGCDLHIRSGTLLLPSIPVIKEAFGLSPKRRHRSTLAVPPVQLQPVVILLPPSAAKLHPQHGFAREGEGKPQGWGKPRWGGSPKLQPIFPFPIEEGSPPFSWRTAATTCSQGDARGGMLGEARSHSSALLLGAAGDWRRVTSPLPRHGRRASPAIFGSGTSAYRREACASPARGLTGREPPGEESRTKPPSLT